MRFKGLDLNLMVLLDTVIEERSISRAAERLNLSQPAASAALSRLRSFFNDELMVTVGRRMMPTLLAEELRPLVKNMLKEAEVVIGTSTSFDPATSNRRFRIGASDYIVTVLITPLIHHINQLAPFLRIDLFPTGPEMFTMLARGEIDMVVGPEPYLSPLEPSELLFSEKHVVLGWNGNAAMTRPMTEDIFFELGHVAVRIGLGNRAFAEGHLARHGDRRRIEVTATQFSAVPAMLVGTKRIAVLQERLAASVLETLPLSYLPLPFDMPDLNEMVQYHETRRADAGLQWLINVLKALSSRR